MKTAHKTLMPIFAMLAIALFASCSSDSSDSDPLGLVGTTWTSSYTTIDRDGSDQNVTTTIEFISSTKVVMYDTYTDEDDGGLVEEDSGTYNVDGSTVTLSLEKGGTYYLIYSSGKLIFAEVYTQTQGLASLGSTISASSLAGTTWKCSVGFSYKDEIYTYTVTLDFGDDAEGVTMTYDAGNYYTDGNNTITATGKYSVSGSTVTIDYDDEYADEEFIYSSRRLVYYNDLMTFTKG